MSGRDELTVSYLTPGSNYLTIYAPSKKLYARVLSELNRLRIANAIETRQINTGVIIRVKVPDARVAETIVNHLSKIFAVRKAIDGLIMRNGAITSN